MELSKATLDQLSGAELREQADAVGVQYASNIGDDTLRKKIMDTLGISSESNSSPSVEAAQGTSEDKPFSKKVTIVINKDKDDKQPVPVAVNGKVYRIVRGEKVTVPVEVLNVLEDAIQVIKDPETEELSEVPAYNYRVVSN